MKSNTIINIIIFFFCFPLMASAQKDAIESQEIIIIKDYKVNLEDAVKVGFSPSTPPAENFKKEKLEYQIPSKLKKLTFEPKPIQPLGLSAQKKETYINSYLKLGFGSQISPLFELNHNQTIHKNIDLNLYAYHFSASRSDESTGWQKFFNNSASIGLNYHTKKIIVKPTLNFDYDHNNFYANDQFFSNKLAIGRNYQKIGFNNTIENVIGKNNLKLKHDFWVGNFKDNVNPSLTTAQKLDFNEYRYGTKIFLEKGIKNKHFLSTEMGIDISQANTFSKNHRAIFHVLPKYFLTLADIKFKIVAGLNFTKEINQFHIMPLLETEKNLLGNALIFYTGWNIKLQVNYYSDLVKDNPYSYQVDTIYNSKVDNRYGGFKGQLGKLNYNLMFSNRNVKNMPLYLADTINSRLFQLVYEPRMVINNLHVAADFELFKKVKLLASTDVFLYEPTTFKRAWNKPVVDINLGFHYQITEKLLLKSEIFMKTNMYSGLLNLKETKLPIIFDLNIGAEYQIAKNWLVFLNVNNLTTSKYRQFIGYNNYGIQGLAGIKLTY